MYKLDKTVVKAQSFKEAEKYDLFSKDVSLEDRLRQAFHLTCTIYGIKPGTPLKIDRSVFSARKFM
jgi:predicted metal-binding protein